MSIRYRLEPTDYWQYHKYYTLHRRLRPVFLYSLIGLVCLVALFGVWISVGQWLHGRPFDAVSLIGPLVIVLYPFLFKTIVLHRAKSSLAYGDESTLVIEKQYVMTTTRTIESKLDWTGIYEIVDTKDYIYFFVTKTHAVLVPKRVFPSKDEAAAFLVAATNYKRNAVPGLAVGNVADTGTWPPSPRIGA